jgi:glycosyltransferase involved in cell wall biosynthesis
VGGHEPSKHRQPVINFAEASRNLHNLFYIGHLPLRKVEEQFDYVQALINTSSVEGFPNTFLQAWSRGMPVFSFVDPDNIITKNSLGSQVDSIDDMAVAIRKSLNDKALFMQQAEKIRNYFTANFSTSQKIKELEGLLLFGHSKSTSKN